MPPTTIPRKRAFKAALANAGTTMRAWAEARALSYSHVRQVVGGVRESQPLEAEIDAFIAEHNPHANAA